MSEETEKKRRIHPYAWFTCSYLALVILAIAALDDRTVLYEIVSDLKWDSIVVQFLYVSILASPACLYLVIRGLAAIRREPDLFRGRWLLRANVGMILTGYVWLYLALFTTVFHPDHARRYSCVNNLKQLGLSMKMYAHESESEYLPFIDISFNQLGFDRNSTHPDYIYDVQSLYCDEEFEIQDSEHALVNVTKAFRDSNFVYLGHAIICEAEGLALFNAYRDAITTGKTINRDFSAQHGQGSGGGATLFRLQEDVEKFFPAEYQDRLNESRLAPESQIPVLMERRLVHGIPGGNVLYLDGHVEFVRMGEKFPYTEAFYNALMKFEADLPELRAAGRAAQQE